MRTAENIAFALGLLFITWAVLRLRHPNGSPYSRGVINRVPLALGATMIVAFQVGPKLPPELLDIAVLAVTPIYVWIFVRQRMTLALLFLAASWLVSENQARILSIVGKTTAAEYTILVLMVTLALVGMTMVLFKIRLASMTDPRTVEPK